jgi:hypothetical protein
MGGKQRTLGRQSPAESPPRGLRCLSESGPYFTLNARHFVFAAAFVAVLAIDARTR